MDCYVNKIGINFKSNAKFSTLLIAGTIVVNLFVYLIIGLSVYNSHNRYNNLAKITTQNMSKTLESNIVGTFDKINIGISSVSQEVERHLKKGDIDKKELSAYVNRKLLEIPEIYVLFVTDSKGNLRFGNNIPDGKWVNVSDRQYFQRIRDNPKEELVFSKLIRGRVSGKWNISIVRRINHPDGTFAGVVIGGFDVSYFNKLFSSLEIGKYGAVGIRDAEYNLVALQPKGKGPRSQIGSNIISEKTRSMIKSNPVTATYKTVFARDNKERMVTFRKTEKYPLYVFAAIAPADYMIPWQKESTVYLVLISIFTLVTITLSRVFYKNRLVSGLHAESTRHAEEMRRQNEELNQALSRVKRLEGTIPICSYCKKIRNQHQSWEQLEKYFTEHSDAMFTHGICPECAEAQLKILDDLKHKK